MKSVEKAIARRDLLLSWLSLSNIVILLILTAILSIAFIGVWQKAGFLGFEFPAFVYPIWAFIRILLLQRLFLILILLAMSHVKTIKVCEKNFHKKVGNYTVRDIWVMVNRLAKEMKVDSLKAVYILESYSPNAMTSDIIAFRPYRRSIVIILSNILEFMNEKELEAVIAHELAHIKNEDTRNLLYVVNPAFLMGFIVVVVALDIPFLSISMSTILLTITTLLLIYGFFFILVRMFLIKGLQRDMENLADYKSVKKVGLLPMANALIKLGQRKEALMAYTNAALRYKFKKMKLKESKEHMKRLGSITDPEEVEMYLLNNMVEKDEKGNPQYIFGASKKKPKTVKGQVIWKDFDTRSPLNWLDYKELETFIKKLKETRNSRIFSYEPRFTIRKVMLSHPTMEDRIVFLWDNIHLEAKRARKQGM